MSIQRGKSGLIICIAAVVLIVFAAGPALAQVTGPCGNCHTMHNSQNGEPVASEYVYGTGLVEVATANENLLTLDCIGCHTAFDGTTWQDPVSGASIVFNTAEPDYGADAGDGKNQGLAGGNFYWASQPGDSANGHNIFFPDTNLTKAPGLARGCQLEGDDSCHLNLDREFTYSPVPGEKACRSCHMLLRTERYHHADDSATVIDSAEQGWYRFLAAHWGPSDVSGIEDDDWEYSSSATDHNEYLGNPWNKTYDSGPPNTMTSFCMGCHGIFHVQNTSPTGADPWIRHPSDAVLPNSGEYASYTVYDPLTPVARPSLTSVSGDVTPGTDMVMCLSCHRAHASPYSDMLRFPYDQMLAGGGGLDGIGCFKCHSQKDGS